MGNTIGNVESVRHIDEGKTKGAAYDTAWTARVTDETGTPLFPECVQWLLENQKSDGSWGCYQQNYHDRILSTLSAVIALEELDETRYAHYIQRGEAYIWENLKNLGKDSCRLVGSELLLPSLMEQAESLGLNLPYHINTYKKEYHRKLDSIEESLWYSPLKPISYSLEFLGDNVDRELLSLAQLPNGSVATSPAATAFFLKYTKDAKAFKYLKKVLSMAADGSVMAVYPIEIFEYGWTMYNFMLAGLYFPRYTQICNFFLKSLGPTGVGSSSELPSTDVDDTAVVCKVLCGMRYPTDVHIFDAYDTEEYYLTFPFEIDPSVSANIHVLDFAKSCSELPDREEVIERLIKFLKREMHSGYWTDKWNVSPYYPTSHAILTLYDLEPSLTEKAVSWILNTQNEDGTWGNNGKLEETAYCVQALMYYHQNVDHIDMSGLSKALSHITGTIFPLTYLAELWIEKVLYCPINVVFSTVASASIMYNTTAWNLCSGWCV
jgi:halimadienyl-diphosphate synthase